MRLVTHFPSYFLIYDCLCPHPFHEMKKDYRLLPGFPNDHKAVQCNNILLGFISIADLS